MRLFKEKYRIKSYDNALFEIQYRDSIFSPLFSPWTPIAYRLSLEEATEYIDNLKKKRDVKYIYPEQ